MSYVDGFLIAVPKDRIGDYREMAELGCKVWMEHGALAYLESVADDAPYGKLTSFPRAVMATEDETVVFAFITYRDRAHRDEVNAKVMADPRMTFEPARMPFDMKRMIFGGFSSIVES